MSYKNKHKEEVARAIQLCVSGDITRESLEYIFPELKEDKQESAYIEFIKAAIEDYYDENNPLRKELIAWLEKQGKQSNIEEVNGEDHGIDGLYHAQRILENTLGSVNGYQSDDGILEHKCAITAVKKLYKQKPVNINVNKMVMKYSRTRDGDFGLPLNCMIKAYEQGINDVLTKKGKQ